MPMGMAMTAGPGGGMPGHGTDESMSGNAGGEPYDGGDGHPIAGGDGSTPSRRHPTR